MWAVFYVLYELWDVIRVTTRLAVYNPKPRNFGHISAFFRSSEKTKIQRKQVYSFQTVDLLVWKFEQTSLNFNYFNAVDFIIMDMPWNFVNPPTENFQLYQTVLHKTINRTWNYCQVPRGFKAKFCSFAVLIVFEIKSILWMFWMLMLKYH